MLEAEEDAWPTDWSPDGGFLIYGQGDHEGRTRMQLWVLPLGRKAKPFPLTGAATREEDARFSPDGRWVAFASVASGREEIYILPFAGKPVESRGAGPGTAGTMNRTWQVSSSGGTDPHWSRDGREILFVSLDGTLMTADVNTQAQTPVSGSPRSLFRIHPLPKYFSFDVPPKGSELLINRMSLARSAPITVVMNWTADLKN